MNLAADYPLLNVFWTIFWFMLWILWFMLLFRILIDLFHDDSVHGWAKAGWAVFLVLLPFLGVFVYLIARGRGMGERELSRTRRSEEGATADQLAKLSELRTAGHITDEEFAKAKAKLLNS
jgi:ABC-type multidrug transport system fused ATPase/permease subunit